MGLSNYWLESTLSRYKASSKLYSNWHSVVYNPTIHAMNDQSLTRILLLEDLVPLFVIYALGLALALLLFMGEIVLWLGLNVVLK